MKRFLPILLVLSIVLPLSGGAFLAWKTDTNFKNDPVVRIKIAGYDPRDLFRGHYITYQFVWNWAEGKAPESSGGSAACLCLHEKTENPRVSLLPSCDQPASQTPPVCAYTLSGRYVGNGSFYPDVQRQYYVDEAFARSLETLLRKGELPFHMGLRVGKNGKVSQEKLYVAGEAVLDYVRTHKTGPEDQ